MMKRLALVLMLLVMSSAAYAGGAYRKTVLYCGWPNNITESFTLYGSYTLGMYKEPDWTVISIQYDDESTITLVYLQGPNDQTRTIRFTSGWPCRIDQHYTPPVQPESDNFNQID